MSFVVILLNIDAKTNPEIYILLKLLMFEQ